MICGALLQWALKLSSPGLIRTAPFQLHAKPLAAAAAASSGAILHFNSCSIRPLPDVLILGAMRAGTTYLHAALGSHPRIVLGPVKEHQFFTLRWEQGIRAYRKQLPIRWPDAVAQAGFRRPLTIDSSPYYLFHPLAPARAASVLKQSLRAIVLLREPAQRAWSHYRRSLMLGHEHLSFLDAIAAEEERLAGENERIASGRELADAPHQVFSYVSRGHYPEQLERWWQFFPREQFLLLKSDELFADTQATLARVCRFLDLDPITFSCDFPRNELPPVPLPQRAQEALNEVFALSNSRLTELTNISFEPVTRHVVHSSTK